VIFVVITALPTKITVFWKAAEEPEDEGYIFLQNVRIYVPECTVSYPRSLWTELSTFLLSVIIMLSTATIIQH